MFSFYIFFLLYFIFDYLSKCFIKIRESRTLTTKADRSFPTVYLTWSLLDNYLIISITGISVNNVFPCMKPSVNQSINTVFGKILCWCRDNTPPLPVGWYHSSEKSWICCCTRKFEEIFEEMCMSFCDKKPKKLQNTSGWDF